MRERRRFLCAVGLNVLVAPLLAIAQTSQRPRRIGVLSGGTRPKAFEGTAIGAFLEGMRDLGYVEGRDFVVEWRFAEGQYDRLAGFAQELVRLNVDVIVAFNTRAALDARDATSTIPIVFAAISDPLGSGLVKSLARPGGNITGFSEARDEVIGKQVELLRTVLPSASRLAALVNAEKPFDSPLVKSLESAVLKAGLTFLPFGARSTEDLEPAFAAMKRDRADAVIVLDDSLFFIRRAQIAGLAAQSQLPSIAGNREYAAAGLLMTYGELISEQFRRSATYVDKVFKGAKPGDLPVEQPTRFHLVVNRKTANSLGITLSTALLLRADDVIQ